MGFFKSIGNFFKGAVGGILGLGKPRPSVVHVSSPAAPPRPPQNDIKIKQINADIEKLKLQHANEEKARQLQNLAQERAHRVELAKIEAAKEAKTLEFELQREKERVAVQERQQQLKTAQRQASITQVEQHISELDAKVDGDEAALTNEKRTFTGLDKQYNIILEWNGEYKQGKYDIDSRGKDDAFKRFESHNVHVKAAVDAVGAVEADVGKVLCMTHNWFAPIMSATINANMLSIKMKTLHDIIKRECQHGLTVEQYFNCHNLARFVPVCEREKLPQMRALYCRDDDELEDMLTVLNEGVGKMEAEEKRQGEYDDEKDSASKPGQAAIELPGAEDEKESAEEEVDETEKAKELLTKWGLGKYWDNFSDSGYNWIEDWQELAENDGLLENCGLRGGHVGRFKRQYIKWKRRAIVEQYKHITAHEQRLLKEVCCHPDSYADVETEQIEATKEGLGAISGLLSDFFGQLRIGASQAEEVLAKQLESGMTVELPTYEAIEYKDQDAKPQADRDLVRRSQQLASEIETTVVSINVTDTMMERFTRDEMSTKALQIAIAVEDCYKQILGSQSSIRRSVEQAMRILSYKPATGSAQSQALWRSVTDGVDQVCRLTISMQRISSQYTAYFLKFQHAFNHYVVNQDKQFEVSLNFLNRDLSDFTKFTSQVTKQVELINEKSMDCISNCVRSCIGAQNFERHREAREIARSAYIEEKKKYDAAVLGLEDVYNEKQQQRIGLAADRAACEYKMSMLEKRIKDNKEFKRQYMTIQASLMQSN